MCFNEFHRIPLPSFQLFLFDLSSPLVYLKAKELHCYKFNNGLECATKGLELLSYFLFLHSDLNYA